MKLLDLFCGAGGAAEGYRRAGFDDIVGIDLYPQPNYPFRFFEDDAMAWGFDLGYFDLIHASPPCQAYSSTRTLHENEYPRYVERIREFLVQAEVPYVIENVVGAPLINPVKLCGSSFGLGVRRHRLFESNMALMSTGCRHDRNRST